MMHTFILGKAFFCFIRIISYDYDTRLAGTFELLVMFIIIYILSFETFRLQNLQCSHS